MSDIKKKEQNPVFQYLDRALVSNNPIFINRVHNYLTEANKRSIPLTVEEARLLSLVDLLNSNEKNPIEQKPLMLGQDMIQGLRDFTFEVSRNAGFNVFNLEEREERERKESAAAGREGSKIKEGYLSTGEYVEYYDAEALRPSWWGKFLGGNTKTLNEAENLMISAFKNAGIDPGIQYTVWEAKHGLNPTDYIFKNTPIWKAYDNLDEDSKLRVQAGLKEAIKPVIREHVESRAKDEWIDNIGKGVIKGAYKVYDWVSPFPVSGMMQEKFFKPDYSDKEVAIAYEDEIKQYKTEEELEKSPLKEKIDRYIENRNSLTEDVLENVGQMFGIILSLAGTKAAFSKLGKFDKMFKLSDRADMLAKLKNSSGILSKSGIIGKYLLSNIGWGMLNPIGQREMGIWEYYNSPNYKENVDTFSLENLGLSLYSVIRPGLEQFTEAIFGAEPLRVAKLGLRFGEIGTKKALFKKIGQEVINFIEMPVTEIIEEELTNFLDETIYPKREKSSITGQLIQKGFGELRKALAGEESDFSLREQKVVALSTILVSLFTRRVTASMVRNFNKQFGEDAFDILKAVYEQAQLNGLDEKVLNSIIEKMPDFYEKRLVLEAKGENQELMASYIAGREAMRLYLDPEADISDPKVQAFRKLSKEIDETLLEIDPNTNALTSTILKGIFVSQPGFDVFNLKPGSTLHYYVNNPAELNNLTSEVIHQLRMTNRDTELAIKEMFEKNNNFGLTDQKEIAKLKLDTMLSVPVITDLKLNEIDLSKYTTLDKASFQNSLTELYKKEGVNYAGLLLKTISDHRKKVQEFIDTTQDEQAKAKAVEEMKEIVKEYEKWYDAVMKGEITFRNKYQDVLITDILGNINIQRKLKGENNVPPTLETIEKTLFGKTKVDEMYIQRMVSSLEAIANTFDPTKTRRANENAIKATKLLGTYYLTNKYNQDFEEYEKQLENASTSRIKDFYKSYPEMVEQEKLRKGITWMHRLLDSSKWNEDSYKFFEELINDIWNNKFNLNKATVDFKKKFSDTTLSDEIIKANLESIKEEIKRFKKLISGTQIKSKGTNTQDRAKFTDKIINTALFAPAFTNKDDWEITKNKEIDKKIKKYLDAKTLVQKDVDEINKGITEAVKKEDLNGVFEIIERFMKYLASVDENAKVKIIEQAVYAPSEFLHLVPIFENFVDLLTERNDPELQKWQKIRKGKEIGIPKSTYFVGIFSIEFSSKLGRLHYWLEDFYNKVNKKETEQTPEPESTSNIYEEKLEYLKKQKIWNKSSERLQTFAVNNILPFVLKEHNFNNIDSYRKITKEELDNFSVAVFNFLKEATHEEVFSFMFYADLFKQTGIGDKEYQHLRISPKMLTLMRYYSYLYFIHSFQHRIPFEGNWLYLPVQDISDEDMVKIKQKIAENKFKDFPVKGTWQKVLDYFGVQGDESYASRLRMLYRQYAWGKEFINNDDSKFIQYHYTFLMEGEIDNYNLNDEEKLLFRQLVSVLGMQNKVAKALIPSDMNKEMDSLIEKFEGKVLSQNFIDKAYAIFMDFDKHMLTEMVPDEAKFDKLRRLIFGGTKIKADFSIDKLNSQFIGYFQDASFEIIWMDFPVDKNNKKETLGDVSWDNTKITIRLDNSLKDNAERRKVILLHEILHPFTFPLFENEEFVSDLRLIYNKTLAAYRDNEGLSQAYIDNYKNNPKYQEIHNNLAVYLFDLEDTLKEDIEPNSKAELRRLNEFVVQFLSGNNMIYWFMSHVEGISEKGKGHLADFLVGILKNNYKKHFKSAPAKNLANDLTVLLDDVIEQVKITEGIKLAKLNSVRKLFFDEDEKSSMTAAVISSFEDKEGDDRKSDVEEVAEKFLVDAGALENIDLYTNYDSQYSETLFINVTNLNRMIDEVAYILGYNPYGLDHYSFIQSLSFEDFQKIFDPKELTVIQSPEAKLKAERFRELLDNNLDYEHTVRLTSKEKLRKSAIRNIYVNILSLFEAPHYSVTNIAFKENAANAKSIEAQMEIAERMLGEEGAMLVKLGSSFKVETVQGKITRSSYRYKVKLIDYTNQLSNSLNASFELSFINDFFGKGFHYKNQSLFEGTEMEPKFGYDKSFVDIAGKESNTAKIAKLIYTNNEFPGIYLLPFADKNTYPFLRVNLKKGETMDQFVETHLIPVYQQYLNLFTLQEDIPLFDYENRNHYPYIASITMRLLVEELARNNTFENVQQGNSVLTEKNFIEIMKRHTPVIELRTPDISEGMIEPFIKEGIVSTKKGDAFYWGKLGNEARNDLYVNVAIAAFQNDSRFLNENGHFIFDGQSLYRIGTFEKINMEVFGSINEGVIKNVLLSQGLFGKHTLQGVNKEEPLMKLFGDKIGVILMDSNEKNTNKNEVRTIRNADGEIIETDNTYEDFLNGTAKTFYVKFSDFHRIQETHDTKESVKGLQQLANSSGISNVNKAISPRLTELMNRIAENRGKEYADKYIEDNKLQKVFVEYFLKVIKNPQGNKQKILSIMFNDLASNKYAITEGKAEEIYSQIKYFSHMPVLYDVMADFLGADVTKAVKYELPGKGLTLSADGGEFFAERVKIAKRQQKEFILNDKDAFKELYPDFKNLDAYFEDIKSVLDIQREIEYWEYQSAILPHNAKYRADLMIPKYKAKKKGLLKVIEDHLKTNYENYQLPSNLAGYDNLFNGIMPPDFAEKIQGYSEKMFRKNFKERDFLKENSVFISEADAKLLKLRVGDRGITGITPSDSAMGMHGVTIAGILPRTHINPSTIVMNSEYIQGVGKDFDADKVSFIIYSEKLGLTKSEWEEFVDEASNIWENYVNLVYDLFVDMKIVPPGAQTVYEKMKLAFNGEAQTAYMKELLGERKDIKTFYSPIDPAIFLLSDVFHKDVGYVVTLRQLHQILGDIGLKFNIMNSTGEEIYKTIDFTDKDIWFKAHIAMMILTNHQVDYPKTIDKDYYNHSSEYIFAAMMGIDYENAPLYIKQAVRVIQSKLTNALNLFMNIPRESSKSYTDSYGKTHYISKTQNSIYKLSKGRDFQSILLEIQNQLSNIAKVRDVNIKDNYDITYPIKSFTKGLQNAFTKANGLLPYVPDSLRKDYMRKIEEQIQLNLIFSSTDPDTGKKLYPITANVLNLFQEIETSPMIARLINSGRPLPNINDVMFRKYAKGIDLSEANLGIKYMHALKKAYDKIKSKTVIGERRFFKDESERKKWLQELKSDNSDIQRYKYHLPDTKFETILPLIDKTDVFIEAFYEWNLTSAYQQNPNSEEYKSQQRVMDLQRALHFLFTGEGELIKGLEGAADKKIHHINYAKQRDHIIESLNVILNKVNRFTFKDIKITENAAENSPYVEITSFRNGNKIRYYDSSGKMIRESKTLRGNPEAYKLINNPATFQPQKDIDSFYTKRNRMAIDSAIPLKDERNITFEEKLDIAVRYIKEYTLKTGMTNSELKRTFINLMGIKNDPTSGKNLITPFSLANDNLYILMAVFTPSLLRQYKDLYSTYVKSEIISIDKVAEEKRNKAGYFYSSVYSVFESGDAESILNVAENEIPATADISKFKKLSFEEKQKEIISLANQIDILKTARAMGIATSNLVTEIGSNLDAFVNKIDKSQTISVETKLEQVENETIRKDKVLNMIYRELSELKSTYQALPLESDPSKWEQFTANGKYDLALAWKYDIPEFNQYTDQTKNWIFAIPNYQDWFRKDEDNPDSFYALSPDAVVSDLSAYAFQKTESGLRQFGAIALTAAKFKRLSLQLSALQREINTANATRDALVKPAFEAPDRSDVALFESRVRDWERKLIRDSNFSIATVGRTGYRLYYQKRNGEVIAKREDEIDSFVDEYINENNLDSSETMKLILKGAIATRVLYNYRIPSVISRTLFFLDHIEKFAYGTPFYNDILVLKAKYRRYRYYLLTNADTEFEFDKKTKKKNFYLKVYERGVFIREYQNYYRTERMIKDNLTKEEANQILKEEAERKIGTEEFYIPFFKDFKDNNLDGDLKQFSADGIFVDKIIQTIGNDIRSIYALQFLDYATKNRVPKVAVEAMKRFMRKQTNSLRFNTKLKEFEDIKEGDYIYFYSIPETDDNFEDIDDMQTEVSGRISAPSLRRGKVKSISAESVELEGDDTVFSREKIYGVNTTDAPKIGYVMVADPKKISERVKLKEIENIPLTIRELLYSKVATPLFRGIRYAAGKLTLGHWLVKPGFWVFNSIGGYLQMAMYMGIPSAFRAAKGEYAKQRKSLNLKQLKEETKEKDIVNAINSVSGYGNIILNILGESSDIDTSPSTLAYFATSAKTKETKKRLRLFNIGKSDKNLVNLHRAIKSSPEYSQVQEYIESKREEMEDLILQRETANASERIGIEQSINEIKGYISILVNNTYLTEEEIDSIQNEEFKEAYKAFINSKDIKFYMPYDVKTLKKLIKRYKKDKETKSSSFFNISDLEARLRADAFYMGYEHAKNVIGVSHAEALEYAMNFVDHTQGFYSDFARRINEDSEGMKAFYALHQFTLNMIRSLRILYRDTKYNIMLNGLKTYLNLYSDVAVDKDGNIIPIVKGREAVEKEGGKVIGRNYGVAALNMLWVNFALLGMNYYLKGTEYLIHPALAPFLILGKILIDVLDEGDKEPKENDIWMLLLQMLSMKMGYGGTFVFSSTKAIAETIEKQNFEPMQWLIPKAGRVGIGYLNMLEEDREGSVYANEKFSVILKTLTRFSPTPRFGTLGFGTIDELGLGLIVPYYPDIKDFGKTDVERKIESKIKSQERSIKEKEKILDDLDEYIRYKQGLPKRKVLGLELY